MAYATLSDVQTYLGPFVPGPSTSPSASQVSELLANCSNEIDAALKSRGLTVPIVAPPEFVTFLVQLNAMGAAGFVLYQVFPVTGSPGSSPMGDYLTKTYQARLADFRKGIGIPVGLAVFEADLSPRGFLTDIGAWGTTATATDAFGDVIHPEPAFSMGKKF
jgi:hypothetical protein